MTMLRIEFPANNKPLAVVLGQALMQYASDGVDPRAALADKAFAAQAAKAFEPVKAMAEGDAEAAAKAKTDEVVSAFVDARDAVEFHRTPIAEELAADADEELNQKQAAAAAEKLADAEPDPARVDTNGVPFNADYCGEAAIPFYASGKNSGQWKKRRGVTDEEYQTWYASCLPEAEATPAEEPLVDTAAAFGGGGQATAAVEAPKDCGAFMGWISAQQVAGNVTPGDITDAYAKFNLDVTSLFPPNDADTVARHINALFTELGGFK